MSDPGQPEHPPRSGAGGAAAGPQPDRPPAASPPFLEEDARQSAEDEARQGPAGGAGTLSPSHLFIKRPIATSLLMAALFLAGIVGFQFLPLSALPEVDYPTIQVQTFYPGASPEVMTSYVTAPLERQFGEMPSLSRMSSISSAGASIITLQFGLDLSLDVAEQEVQAAMNAAGNLLPSDLPAPPVYAKVNPADAPILTLALSSGGAHPGEPHGPGVLRPDAGGAAQRHLQRQRQRRQGRDRRPDQGLHHQRQRPAHLRR
jgi:hypothetical protein